MRTDARARVPAAHPTASPMASTSPHTASCCAWAGTHLFPGHTLGSIDQRLDVRLLKLLRVLCGLLLRSLAPATAPRRKPAPRGGRSARASPPAALRGGCCSAVAPPGNAERQEGGPRAAWARRCSHGHHAGRWGRQHAATAGACSSSAPWLPPLSSAAPVPARDQLEHIPAARVRGPADSQSKLNPTKLSWPRWPRGGGNGDPR